MVTGTLPIYCHSFYCTTLLEICPPYLTFPFLVFSQPLSLTIVNSSDEGVAPLRVCPGQRFQVAKLQAHLQAAPVSANDVLLKPYLASWDELIK